MWNVCEKMTLGRNGGRDPGVLLAEFHSMERNEKFCGVREKFD